MPQMVTHPGSSRTSTVTPAFECTMRDGGLDAAWVRVAGELDIANAPKLQKTLLEAEARAGRVVLDLRELVFVDCCGVHVIVRASTRIQAAGGRLVIVRGRSQVDRVFALTKRSEVLEIVDLNPAEPPVQALVQLARKELGGLTGRSSPVCRASGSPAGFAASRVLRPVSPG